VSFTTLLLTKKKKNHARLVPVLTRRQHKRDWHSKTSANHLMPYDFD